MRYLLAVLTVLAVTLLSACGGGGGGGGGGGLSFESPTAMLERVADVVDCADSEPPAVNLAGATYVSCWGPNGETVYLGTFDADRDRVESLPGVLHVEDGWYVAAQSDETVALVVDALTQ